jgi:hypothetical protein
VKLLGLVRGPEIIRGATPGLRTAVSLLAKRI